MSTQPSLGHLHLQTPLLGKKPWMLECSLLYSTEVSSLPFLLIGPGSPLQGHRTNLVGLLHANPLFNRSPKALLSPHHWGDILKFQQRVPVSKRDTVCVSSWSGSWKRGADPSSRHPAPRLPLRWLQRAAALWRLHSGLGSLGGCLFLTPVDLTFIHFTVDLTGYFLPRKLRPWAVGTRHLFWHQIMQIFFFF